MSDHITKIIPKDPFYKVSDLKLQSAKSFLQTQLHCDFIEVEVKEAPAFIDCGENLEKISCPVCSTKLDFGWWGEAMNIAAENDFASLKTETPCCKSFISLNDLDYYFPCGFASSLICIFNPEQSLDDEIIDAIENIFGVGIRIVEAHI